MARRKYDYMIKTLREKDGKLLAYGDFEYPKKKGALVLPEKWSPEPECGNGIHGTVGWTPQHYIEDNDVWIILKYVRDEAVIINNDKIKVPRAWMVAWGEAEPIQKMWENLTGHKYEYDYVVRTAGDNATITAKGYAIITAGDNATITAEDDAVITAKYNATIKVKDAATVDTGYVATIITEDDAVITTGNSATITTGDCVTITAGDNAIITTGNYVAITAGNGSVITIKGKECTIDVRGGRVFVVFKFKNFITYVFLSTTLVASKHQSKRCCNG